MKTKTNVKAGINWGDGTPNTLKVQCGWDRTEK